MGLQLIWALQVWKEVWESIGASQRSALAHVVLVAHLTIRMFRETREHTVISIPCLNYAGFFCLERKKIIKLLPHRLHTKQVQFAH